MEYDEIDIPYNLRLQDLVIVKLNDKRGLFHTGGVAVTPIKYDYDDGKIKVIEDKESHFIDTSGKRVSSPKLNNRGVANET